MVEPRRGAQLAATSCSPGCARRSSSRPQQEQEARTAPLRVIPYRSDSERRHGYAKAYLRQRFRDEFGGDHPPDWRVDTTFVAELQDAAEAAVENGLEPDRQADAAGRTRRNRSGDRQYSRAGRRPRLFSARPSIAPAAASASPARRSSRSCLPRRSSAACRPCRC